ncbi:MULTISPECIES: glycosyltransferase family 1 protein [Microbacterium]|uniref:glycosyltransferase family 1 protein n=1 Tax=Microbacterium TaxID=33882 RepID=UPI001B7CFE59|nr:MULTISPECIES: glycosyltransferase family 1 protein [Microbacterium]
MTKQQLLILSFSPIASDARVLKQVAAFRDRYDVTTCGYGPAPQGVASHVEVPSELAVWRYSRPLVIARQYRRAYWGNGAVAFAREGLAGRRFDIVLADDVDAVGLALSLRPRGGVHADLHEYSPRQHEEMLRFRLFVKPFIEWMCRKFVARATSWSTVSGGLAREYERRFGFAPDVVTNAAPFADVAPTPVHEPLRLVHSGAALRNRHLDTLLAGVRASRSATLDLYLTKNDAAYLDELARAASVSGGRIRVHDPVPYDQLAATLRGYDVGVHILPPVNFNNRWALPNKVFDYVQARLGIIVGPSPEMADYVRRFGLGTVTEDFGAESLTAAVDALTPTGVEAFKRSAHSHAKELSSESQVLIWERAIDRLAASAQIS